METSPRKDREAWKFLQRRPRSQRHNKRSKWGMAAAGCIWMRPWSPVSFSVAQTHHTASRRHIPTDVMQRGRAGATLCCEKRPGRLAGAGFIALSVFGFFEGPTEGEGDAKDSKRQSSRGRRRKEDDALRRLLLQGHGEHTDSFKRTLVDWWESLPLVGQKRRIEKEEAHSKDRLEGPEDAASGAVNILASVKTSVVAAVLGTGRPEEISEDEKEDDKESNESFPPFLPEFSAPGLFGETPTETRDTDSADVTQEASAEKEEDWWQNAQAALGMAQTEEQEERKEEKKEREKEEKEVEAEPKESATERFEVEEPLPREEEVVEVEAAATPEPAPQEELEPPVAPGMEDANLIVRVDIDPKRQRVELGEKAIRNLMSQSDRKVLEAMAQEGWEVEVVDESKGLYMLSLPSVLYEVMGTSVSIPAPRFLTKLRDKSGTFSQFEERLEGDLVLQNGENIFTLQLGFPFRTKLTISAAGWTRAKVGFEGDEILSSNYVEVGIQLPKVPGLTNIMEYFVKNYGTQSTQECTDALARAAERLPETPLQSIEDTMKEFLKPLTDPEGNEKKLVGSGPGRPPT
ncbi:unnamed protein product [Durusdinium trenchii]|uniref:Calcium-dependent protein kinase 16 n=2 Tax=Durusdinium trenchii TaxID=1381693 RepID=A0ABP0ISQ5_9DINO